MSRPERLAVVCGTATDVGKTWVTCGLLHGLRQRGVPVAARKPAQSFAEDGRPTDAELLAAASGQDPWDVCPAHRWYPAAMAPPMAAAALGRDAFSSVSLAARASGNVDCSHTAPATEFWSTAEPDLRHCGRRHAAHAERIERR